MDTLARRLREMLSSPAQRDLLGFIGIAVMLLALALWKPLLGLFLFGAVILAVAFVVSMVATAPKEDATNDE